MTEMLNTLLPIAVLMTLVAGGVMIGRRAASRTVMPEPATGAPPEKAPGTPETPRTCGHCRHYDFEEGQAAMNRYPIFKAAAAVVPPSEMGAIVEYDEDGNKKPQKGTGVPQKARWDRDFGACTDPDKDEATVVYKGDSCEHWSPRTPEQREEDRERAARLEKIDIERGRVA